jgi:hypothetical protein
VPADEELQHGSPSAGHFGGSKHMERPAAAARDELQAVILDPTYATVAVPAKLATKLERVDQRSARTRRPALEGVLSEQGVGVEPQPSPCARNPWSGFAAPLLEECLGLGLQRINVQAREHPAVLRSDLEDVERTCSIAREGLA